MFVHLIRGILLWLNFSLFPLFASLPFFWILWILGKDKTQRPQWEWLEDIDSEDVTRVIGLIVIVWLVSGVVMLLGTVFRAIVEEKGPTVDQAVEEAEQEMHDRRKALLAEEDAEV